MKLVLKHRERDTGVVQGGQDSIIKLMLCHDLVESEWGTILASSYIEMSDVTQKSSLARNARYG